MREDACPRGGDLEILTRDYVTMAELNGDSGGRPIADRRDRFPRAGVIYVRSGETDDACRWRVEWRMLEGGVGTRIVTPEIR